MAFSNPVSGVITQTGTDTDLSGLASSTGVTTTFQGSIAHYNPGAGISITVSGTLTINPEENVLDSSANQILTVSSTGRLNLGIEITSPRDGSIRKTEGVAITGSRAQLSWIGVGSNASIVVQNGGELEAKGAITRFPGMYSFSSGSSIWLDGLEHHCHDYNIADGDIDPQTGVAVVDSTVGVNVGTNNRLGTQAGNNLPGRGYLGFLDTEDIRVDDWKLIGGGEFVFRIASDSDNNNTLSKTPNGFFGYSAADAKAPIISDRGLAQKSEAAGNNFIIENVRLANSGNLKSIALQSNDTGGTIGEAYITNAFNGTELTIGSDKLVSDARNGQVYGTIGRNINVDIKDGLDGSTITGGAFFYKDTNNGNRKNLNGFNDNPFKTSLSALTNSELSSDHKVILKIVNVTAGDFIGGTSNDERGQDRTTSFALSGTTFTFTPTSGSTVDASVVGDVYIFEVTTNAEPPMTTTTTTTETTAGNTTFTVPETNSDDTFVVRIQKVFNERFIGDLRTNSGIEGTDTFDFVFWHEDYNPALFIDLDLQDDTVGTKVLVANILKDADYSSSTGTTANTPDELYDFIKQTKSDINEALVTGVEFPTLSTLAVSKDSGLLDIGIRTFATENSTSQYTISDSALSAHTTDFGGGTVFAGVKTTGTIDLDGIDISTCTVETTSDLLNFPTTIPDGANTTGTVTVGTGTPSLTIGSTADVTGLDIVVPDSTTLSITGRLTVASFASIVDSAGTALTADTASSTGAKVVFIEDLGNTIFEIPSGLPSGKVILKLRSASEGTYVADTTHTTGALTTVATITNVSSSSGTYDMYFKPTNTFGTDGIFYITTAVSGQNNGIIDQTVSITHVEHPDVLTTAAEQATLTGLTATVSTVTTGTTATITIAGATTVITAAQTQAILMRAMDDANYLNLIANNQTSVDIVDYLLPDINSALEVDESKLTLTALNASGQQIITGVSGKGSGDLVETMFTGGTPDEIESVIIISNPAGLSETQAKNASGDALDERLVTANNMENIGLGTPVVKDGSLGTTFHSS